MHNAIAHHPLTDAQPIPKQLVPPPQAAPPILIVQHDVRWDGMRSFLSIFIYLFIYRKLLHVVMFSVLK